MDREEKVGKNMGHGRAQKGCRQDNYTGTFRERNREVRSGERMIVLDTQNCNSNRYYYKINISLKKEWLYIS